MAKQEAAVTTHSGATRAPEQARVASPMSKWAVKAWVPAGVGVPTTACAADVDSRAPAAAVAQAVSRAMPWVTARVTARGGLSYEDMAE